MGDDVAATKALQDDLYAYWARLLGICMQDETGERDRKEAEFRRAAERSVIPIEELRRIAFENGVQPSFIVQMSDETGERDDAITVDEQGCVVNTDWRSEPSKDEQRAAREREMYEAWRKKAEGKR